MPLSFLKGWSRGSKSIHCSFAKRFCVEVFGLFLCFNIVFLKFFKTLIVSVFYTFSLSAFLYVQQVNKQKSNLTLLPTTPI